MLISTLIAGARAERSQYLARFLKVALKRGARRLRLWGKRIALARRQRSELDMLLRADDRILSDIGLTRADVRFAAMHGRGLDPREARDCAAARVEEARNAASTHLQSLPHIGAPTLAAGLPQPVEHSNFR
jgi:uncharacterized protein YjiS (DUF1127 family)